MLIFYRLTSRYRCNHSCGVRGFGWRTRHSKCESSVFCLSPCICLVLSCFDLTVLSFSSQTIYNAMLNGTPCVILEGSGRIADVIAQVAALPVSRVTIILIHQLMKKFFGQEYDKFPDLSILEWTKKVCEHADNLSNNRPNYCLFLTNNTKAYFILDDGFFPSWAIAGNAASSSLDTAPISS